MKHFLISLTFILSLFVVMAQDGTIYNFAFKIDDNLVTQMQAQNKDHKILNLSTIEDMP